MSCLRKITEFKKVSDTASHLGTLRLTVANMGQDSIGRAWIGCMRKVIDDGQPCQRLDVNVVWQRRQGVNEKDQRIKPFLRDHRTDLLIAPQGPRS